MKQIINGIIGAAQGAVDFFAFYLFLMLFADFLDRMGQE
jgi:hypothetical protein